MTDNKYEMLNSDENQNNDRLDLESLLFEDSPNTANHTIIKDLKKFYRKRPALSKNNLVALGNIYIDAHNFSMNWYKCAPIYRDVLVFYQKDKMVGLSKICFECKQQYTIDQFGDKKEFDTSDFEKLEQILK